VGGGGGGGGGGKKTSLRIPGPGGHGWKHGRRTKQIDTQVGVTLGKKRGRATYHKEKGRKPALIGNTKKGTVNLCAILGYQKEKECIHGQ